MNTRRYSGSKVRPTCKADNLSSVSWSSRQCGILDISQPYRPPQPVTGIALLLFFYRIWMECPTVEVLLKRTYGHTYMETKGWHSKKLSPYSGMLKTCKLIKNLKTWNRFLLSPQSSLIFTLSASKNSSSLWKETNNYIQRMSIISLKRAFFL
jgi:hypothetical protein